MSAKNTFTLYHEFEDTEENVTDFPIFVDYYVWGSHRRATMHDPPESPEIEIECYRIPKSLAVFLGCNEVLDVKKVEELVGEQEISKLADQLLNEYDADAYDDYEPDLDDLHDFDDDGS